ncbi:MAG: hypothetical protein CBC35_00840 [Planctomycetes bacterium TMED75]|nr:hypothetical protein [Planctomycetaceae bacterium]OUU96636.1 MAG: hypothetical protein CBC35_00840 [Planctomycetes bacterium TMED75]
MSLLEQLLAISKNTFKESIRQPVLFVVSMAATLFIILSNPFATFTLEDDQRMFVDIGLSSVFLAGVLGSAFIATNVLTKEIENRTVLTVVSKPVPRPLFIIGKFLGVVGSLMVMMTYLITLFMIVDVHGSLETAAAKYHMPVIVLGAIGFFVAIGIGIWCNYFYNWTFGATTLGMLVPISIMVYVLSLVFGRQWELQPIGTDFKGQLWIASGMLFMAVLVLSAIAIAASTRLNQVATLVITCFFFLLGLLSDWLFARPAANMLVKVTDIDEPDGSEDAVVVASEQIQPLMEGASPVTFWFLNLAHDTVPNFQVFWLADAVNQKHDITITYIISTLAYGGLLITAAVCLAVILFQKREVG